MRVRQRWREAPGWVLSLVMGLLFSVGMAGFSFVEHRSWLIAVITGVLGGVFFGAVMGRFAVRSRHRARDAVGGSQDAHEAAVRLGEHRVQLLDRQLRWALPVFGVVAIAYLVGAALTSWWWLSGTVVFGGVLALSWWQRRRLRRRVAELRQG